MNLSMVHAGDWCMSVRVLVLLSLLLFDLYLYTFNHLPLAYKCTPSDSQYEEKCNTGGIDLFIYLFFPFCSPLSFSVSRERLFKGLKMIIAVFSGGLSN